MSALRSVEAVPEARVALDLSRLSDEAKSYLDLARKCGFLQRIEAAFERASSLKIAFVGERIIDEYRYVESLPGRPSKEFTLATVQTGTEAFWGGVDAAAAHMDWPKASVVSINQSITKTRFVAQHLNRKLFEVYDKSSVSVGPEQRQEFQRALDFAVSQSDVVIAFDFGHGLIGSDECVILGTEAKFLAVNAQTNAGNHGFNLVTKYPRADLVVVDEPEARLATGMQNDPVLAVFSELSHVMEPGRLIITRGRDGCMSGSYGVPAFAGQAVDTMGAGDAFLATAAPLIAAGLDLEPAAFVGNVAGAIKVGIVGHQRSVGRDELMQTIRAML